MSVLLSTGSGTNSEPEPELYMLMQFVATFGLFANIFVISPVSSALGVFDATEKEVGIEDVT